MPPPKTRRRPIGFPEARSGNSEGQPAPREEDEQGIGWDDVGMVPEEEANTEGELEDLNIHPIGMDRHSDSPNPMSPCQAAYLDRAVDEQVNNQEPDSVVSVLAEVPSAQPATLPPRGGISPPRRVVTWASSAHAPHRARQERDAEGASVSTTAPPISLPSPASFVSSSSFSGTGRSILRLRSPPKAARIPASRRRPPPCDQSSKPLFTIRVETPPTVEFTAPTPPPLEDSQPFTPSLDSSQFQDADEPMPLIESWADIMEREDAQQSAPAASVSATLATIPAPVAAINAAAASLSELQTPAVSTAGLSLVPPTSATPAPPVQSVTAIPGVLHLEAPTGASTAVVDSRRLLTDDDITHGVRLASTADADVIVNSLMSSFRTSQSREELTRLVSLMLDILWDTSVFLRERISVARLQEQSSDDILDEVMRQLQRFVGKRSKE